MSDFIVNGQAGRLLRPVAAVTIFFLEKWPPVGGSLRLALPPAGVGKV